MSRSASSELLRTVRWPLVALAVLLAFNLLFTPGFFSLEMRDGRLYGVLVDIVNHGAIVGIVALGMTLVIATGGVDLSVGAVVAISGALTATLLRDSGASWPVAMLCAVVVSTACGLGNGILVVFVRLQPIVATLILMVAGRGIAQLITDGLIVTLDDPALAFVGNGVLFGLPFPVILLLVLAGLTAFAVRRTNLGLFIEATGGNTTASRLAGVPERAVRLVAYAFCGACAGVAGIIECSYIQAADVNNAGHLLELDVILAVVIGGTALTGGRFRLLGALIGALILQTLTTTLYMQDVSAYIAPAPKAVAVIVVCLLQSPVVRERLARRREVTS